jgi:uncharacterized protein (TIGR00725 family)
VQLAVVGAGAADPELADLSCQVGRAVAEAGAVLICGGLGGVMEGACRGAVEAGGLCVAILPGADPTTANPWATVVVATGLGHARNAVVVQSADAVIALPGSWGTLSEIALARKSGRPVVGLGAWDEVAGVRPAASPREAVNLAFALAGRGA